MFPTSTLVLNMIDTYIKFISFIAVSPANSLGNKKLNRTTFKGAPFNDTEAAFTRTRFHL